MHDKSDPLLHQILSRECVIELANERGLDIPSSIKDFAINIGMESHVRPRLENREAPEESSIWLEVVNTFHNPVFLTLVGAEQVVTFAKQYLREAIN